MKINLKDKLELEGKRLSVGDQAPDFTLAKLVEKTIDDVTLKEFGNKIKVISVFPSIDTGVCDIQTKKFIEKYSNINNLVLINVSGDLPFAFAKWCANNNAENLVMLSDFRDHSFAKSYGLNVKGANLCYRALIVLDENNKVLYAQYPEYLPNHLNYDDIDNFLKNIIK